MGKKIVVVTPESKIAGANIHVEAQQSQFTQMITEVKYAVDQRCEAIDELYLEADSLRAQLKQKLNAIETAEYQNEADLAFMKRLKELAGI